MAHEMLASTEEEKAYIDDQLGNFNRRFLGIPLAAQSSAPLSYIIKADDQIIAGINAYVYFLKSLLHVDILFVEEAHRGQKLGGQLLRKVENEAKAMGAKLAHLDKFDWQAKDFYLKMGYDIFGELEDCPEGHTRYYMKKKL